MQVLYQRVAGIDVHKKEVRLAVRVPGDEPGTRRMEIRKYKTFYGVLKEMTAWLTEQGVTHVAMESSGIYTMPVFHALLEFGSFEQVAVCNAAHVKNVPGRKTDSADAAWLAERWKSTAARRLHPARAGQGSAGFGALPHEG